LLISIITIERRVKGKEHAIIGSNLDVVLPAFSLPIGQLQVNIENLSGKLWVDLVLESRKKTKLTLSFSRLQNDLRAVKLRTSTDTW
jgi:hypothetical protein